MSLFDDLLFRALFAGLAIAIIAAPLGCFILWHRLAYFGDSLAHTAFLGAACAFFFEFNLFLGTVSVAIFTALVLSRIQHQTRLSSDSLLGVISHSSLAVALLMAQLPNAPRFDLMALLQGEILLITLQDLLLISVTGIIILVLCVTFWRKFLAMTISPDIARAENFGGKKESLILMLLIAIFTAVAIKIVGILMVAAFLIIPAASANLIVNRMRYQPLWAGVFGITSVLFGMNIATEWNLPLGPCIVALASIGYIISLVFHLFKRRS